MKVGLAVPDMIKNVWRAKNQFMNAIGRVTFKIDWRLNRRI